MLFSTQYVSYDCFYQFKFLNEMTFTWTWYHNKHEVMNSNLTTTWKEKKNIVAYYQKEFLQGTYVQVTSIHIIRRTFTCSTNEKSGNCIWCIKLSLCKVWKIYRLQEFIVCSLVLHFCNRSFSQFELMIT